MKDYHQKNISEYKTFFFDLDGTLINSNKLHEKAFQMILDSTDSIMTKNFNYSKYMGMKTSEVFTLMGYDNKFIEELTYMKQSIYRQYIENKEVELFPYVDELLEKIIVKGYKAYIVTGSSLTSVNLILKYSKLGLYINDFICGDEVKKSKPDPEIYLSALKKFDLNPDEVLAIEDSYNGIISAVNAGIRTVSVNDYCNHHLVQFLSLEEIYRFLS